MIITCDKKKTFCLDATEHVLTIDIPQNEDALFNRIQYMLSSEGCGKGSAPFDALSKKCIKKNFIIHEVHSFIDSSRICTVRFIVNRGVVVDDTSRKNV